MSWSTSDRRSSLPSNWAAIRRRVLKRDEYQCTWIRADGSGDSRCGEPATDVDHIIPSGSDSMDNLRSLCSYHHSRKSSTEGGLAAAAKKAAIRGRFSRSDKHPGLL